ncbi:MAG TPA: TonB-dependent receptor [Pseudolabrys sp.]|nr:TonB-dependent receptor [Pseudolabrys sp.]
MVTKYGIYLGTALFIGMNFSPPAIAQAQAFDIAAQPASSGIQTFGRQARVQMLSARKDTDGKKTNGVHGRMTVDEALRQLLSGTGLTALSTGERTYTVVRQRRQVSAARAAQQGGNTVPPTAPAAASDGSDGSEIVVTAQKRLETAFEVPLSISVKGEEEIQKRNAQTITDLQYSVPGLSISEFGPGTQRIQFRGISSYSGLPQIGIYLDEMPLNTESGDGGPDVRLIDIARVEMLRGPQGTLYGQGAMGGTIRYITNNPDLTRVSGSALGEVSVIDGGGIDWRAEGVLNLPVVEDRLGVRLVGGYTRLGGWIDNPVTGRDRTNRGESYVVRGKVLAKLTDDLTATFTGSHQNLDIGADNVANDDEQTLFSIATPRKSRINLFSAVLNYDLGPVTLVSATSWQDRKGADTIDLTAILGPLAELLSGQPSGTVTAVAVNTSSDFRAFSQELRAQYDDGGPFRAIIGGFYRNSASRSTTLSAVEPAAATPAGFYEIAGNSTSTSWAVFGDFTYGLLDNLDVNVGLRYFEDKRTSLSNSSVLGTTATDTGADTFTAFTPKFNISWQASDALNLYATASKGFRSGGFNNTSVGGTTVVIPPTYDPDSVWTYETGAKFQSADRRVYGEVSVYRNEWSGIQSVATVPIVNLAYTANGGKMAGYGVDAQLSFRPVSPLTLTLTGGWNNMKYKITTPEHNEGDRADYAPRFTGSASAEYRFDLASNVPAFARLDYQLADGIQIYFRNYMPAAVNGDTQHYLNFNVGADIGSVSLQLFVKNILDDYSVTYPAFGSLPYPGRPLPRSFGAQVQARF